MATPIRVGLRLSRHIVNAAWKPALTKTRRLPIHLQHLSLLSCYNDIIDLTPFAS